MVSIEENIFKRATVDFMQSEKFGFVKTGGQYRYEKVFMDGDFKAVVTIDENGKINGEVYDLASDDIYFPLRVEEMSVGYVGEVRSEYEKILQNIREKCCRENYFIGSQTNRIATLIAAKYGDKPDFPWEKYDDCGVFRNPDTNKWYALVMNIDRKKIAPKQSGNVEIMNIKLDAEEILQLHKQNGFYPAYHMNKKSWITLVLDDTLDDRTVEKYLDKSHEFTVNGKGGKNIKGIWLVPANPRFFDIEKAFAKNNEIIWKQSSDIKVGDIAYMYVGAPYSAVLYKCLVTEVNIPYDYVDENLQIKKVMKIKCLQKYAKNFMPFAKLKKFGINAVRGPRGIPECLYKQLDETTSEAVCK